jgi:hypothetical protein
MTPYKFIRYIARKVSIILTAVLLLLIMIGCRKLLQPELFEPLEGRTAVLLDDLEDGDSLNEFGGKWYTRNDTQFGGDSEVIPAVFRSSSGGPAGSDKCAQISGRVTTTFDWGFIGVGTNLNKPANPVDIQEFNGIEFWTKGDGKVYRMKFRSNITTDYDDFGYDFTATNDWTRVNVDFSALYQQGWGRERIRMKALSAVIGINWQTIDQPLDKVKLAVDHIRFLK